MLDRIVCKEIPELLHVILPSLFIVDLRWLRYYPIHWYISMSARSKLDDGFVKSDLLGP